MFHSELFVPVSPTHYWDIHFWLVGVWVGLQTGPFGWDLGQIPGFKTLFLDGTWFFLLQTLPATSPFAIYPPPSSPSPPHCHHTCLYACLLPHTTPSITAGALYHSLYATSSVTSNIVVWCCHVNDGKRRTAWATWCLDDDIISGMSRRLLAVLPLFIALSTLVTSWRACGAARRRQAGGRRQAEENKTTLRGSAQLLKRHILSTAKGAGSSMALAKAKTPLRMVNDKTICCFGNGHCNML